MNHPRNLLLILAMGLSLAAFGCSHDSSGHSPLGTWSNEFLSDDTYTSMRVEIDYVDGRPPSAAALSLLEKTLTDRCHKPGGIEILVDDAIPAVASPTSTADAQALEQRYRDDRSEGSRAVLYLLYLNGDSAGGSYFAVTYGASSIAIFGDTIDNAGGGAYGSARQIEESVLIHELGHVLGLVNRGAPMVEFHEDLTHRGHDTNSRCVMHHRIETTSIAFFSSDGPPPTEFDAKCIADMQAHGGK